MPDLDLSTLEAVIPLIVGIAAMLLGFRRWSGAGRPRSRGARRALRWVGPVLIAFAIFMFISGRRSQPAQAEAIVAGIKAKMHLPVQVDADTRLDDVRALSRSEVGYLLTLTTTTRAQLAASPLARQLESNLRDTACRNPDYATLFKAGISLHVSYRTSEGAPGVEVALAPKDCGY